MKQNHLISSLLCATTLFGTTLAATRADASTSQGICFRFDDNKSLEEWRQMRDVFEKHQLRFSMAINSSAAARTPEYAQMLREMSEAGYEIMDHSPNHSIIQLNLADAERYADQDFVEKRIGNTLFFRFVFQADHPDNQAITLSVNGDKLTAPDPETAKLLVPYKFLVADDGAIYGICEQNGEKVLCTQFGELGVTLAPQPEWHVICTTRNAFHIPDEALQLVAETTQKNYAAMQLAPPRTFITPGGWGLFPTAEQMKRVYQQQYGYQAGDQYDLWSCSSRGRSIDRFRMYPFWNSLERVDVTEEKRQIADLMATNHVVPIISHMWSNQLEGGFATLLERYDQFLDWVCEKQIPVKNYAEWSEVLYASPSLPSGNVFPSLTTDLDGNGLPDGYRLHEKSSATDGVLSGEAGTLANLVDLVGIGGGRYQMSVDWYSPSGKAEKLLFVFHCCDENSRQMREDVIVTFRNETPDAKTFFSGVQTLDLPEWVAGAHVNIMSIGGSAALRNPQLVRVSDEK